MTWFYAAKGESLGPYSADDLKILLQSGEIGPDTLLWRQGSEWTPLRERPQFAELVGRSVAAPPVPEKKARAKPPKPSRVSSAPMSQKPKRTARDTLTGKPAGPWSRFFARMADMMLLIALVFTELTVMAYPKTMLPPEQFIPLNILALLTLFIVYFGLSTAFNFFGKALVGIRVVDLAGHKLSFFAVLWREVRVFFYLLTLHPPIGTAIHGFAAFILVGRGQPTKYDAARAAVIETPRYAVWRIPGAIVFATLCLTFSLILLFASEDGPGRRWTNPATGITVALPAPWKPDRTATSDLRFTNVPDGRIAYFACTAKAPGLETLDEYQPVATAELQTLGQFYTFLGPSAGTGTRHAIGRLESLDAPATAIIGEAGETFCRIIYADIIEATDGLIFDDAMTEALFESVGGAARQ